MILSAQTIRALCLDGRSLPLVMPFSERAVVRGRSHGLSAASYDVRCAQSFRLFPGDFLLASTVERVCLPADLLAFVKDKSSWARIGVAVQNTLIDPGFRGHVTLELSNHSPRYVDVEEGDPIAQLVFCRLDQPTDLPYSGKYQDQGRDPQPAIEEEEPR
jgi:dCTP deaminase